MTPYWQVLWQGIWAGIAIGLAGALVLGTLIWLVARGRGQGPPATLLRAKAAAWRQRAAGAPPAPSQPPQGRPGGTFHQGAPLPRDQDGAQP